MAFIRRYICGNKFEYITAEQAEELRRECHKEMREIAPDGTPAQTIFEMGEYLYKMQLTPKK